MLTVEIRAAAKAATVRVLKLISYSVPFKNWTSRHARLGQLLLEAPNDVCLPWNFDRLAALCGWPVPPALGTTHGRLVEAVMPARLRNRYAAHATVRHNVKRQRGNAFFVQPLRDRRIILHALMRPSDRGGRRNLRHGRRGRDLRLCRDRGRLG